MDARGAICEMALVGVGENPAPSDSAHGYSAEALRQAGRVFLASGCLAPLTMDHPLDVGSQLPLPEQLCRDFRITAVGRDLLPEAGPNEAGAPIYPSAKVVYNVPLSDRLINGAHMLSRYQEFRPALRVRLLPYSQDGARSPFGALRAAGLRVEVPAGIGRMPALQERFFSLLGQSSRQGLRMLAGGIKGIEDFDWLRMQPDVLFQGEVLSIALSLDYIQEWLAVAGACWRRFRLGA